MLREARHEPRFALSAVATRVEFEGDRHRAGHKAGKAVEHLRLVTLDVDPDERDTLGRHTQMFKLVIDTHERDLEPRRAIERRRRADRVRAGIARVEMQHGATRRGTGGLRDDHRDMREPVRVEIPGKQRRVARRGLERDDAREAAAT